MPDTRVNAYSTVNSHMDRTAFGTCQQEYISQAETYTHMHTHTQTYFISYGYYSTPHWYEPLPGPTNQDKEITHILCVVYSYTKTTQSRLPTSYVCIWFTCSNQCWNSLLGKLSPVNSAIFWIIFHITLSSNHVQYKSQQQAKMSSINVTYPKCNT